MKYFASPSVFTHTRRLSWCGYPPNTSALLPSVGITPLPLSCRRYGVGSQLALDTEYGLIHELLWVLRVRPLFLACRHRHALHAQTHTHLQRGLVLTYEQQQLSSRK